MSAQSGWYPDPGGGLGLYRYWDGKAWSAATSPNPAAPPPVAPLGAPGPPQPTAQPGIGQPYGQAAGYGGSYAGYQAQAKKKSPWGWWLGAAALLVVIVVIAVFVIRGLGNGGLTPSPPDNQASGDSCPPVVTPTAPNPAQPGDGRVHGGPVSYPQLGAPWSEPRDEFRVPFGIDAETQSVLVEQGYAPNSDWVASILVAELQAGDGFFTPQQGAQIVVKCIIGTFYGDNPVQSDVKVNKATKVEGHDAWTVESHLTFDVPNLKTKGEEMIVTIVATGSNAGLFYASIPDTTPNLLQPARDALKQLQVDG